MLFCSIRESQDPTFNGDEEDGPDGHLNEPWVVAVAVSVSTSSYCTSLVLSLTFLPIAVVVCCVAAIILVIKWRQRRQNHNRGRQNYSRTADELAAAGVQGPPYQQAWKGPYASRSSYTRSPSPVRPCRCIDRRVRFECASSAAFPSASR